jgi:asparagine synthetase B (glutamine-hydrolysing)
MSDFIYSSRPKPPGRLAGHIRSIYRRDPPEVAEYHGEWGSLGVSRNLYNGFQPMETDRHVVVVIGGPVLDFQSNLFLTGRDPVAGTRALWERVQSGKMRWDDDLSGPFVVLSVDKAGRTISLVTDLLMFIPVHRCFRDGVLTLGTHVDALAAEVGRAEDLDFVSVLDFIVNGTVTHPFSFYENILQCSPATVYDYEVIDGGCRPAREGSVYWQPRETHGYADIREAARAIRDGLINHVDRVTEGMTHVAHFLSGGEDSRAVAGLLPQRLKRDAYIFLDGMNRQGRIAEKAARAYGSRLTVGFREKTHYLDILPEASDLIGSGRAYMHAHTLGFHKTCGLSRYPAVFGGYLADTFLKGYYMRNPRVHGRFPFLPQFVVWKQPSCAPLKNKIFSETIRRRVYERRKQWLESMEALRPESAPEWSRIYPRTMGESGPNLCSNRRLFRTYEPFISNQVIKVAAGVPQSWKLNRSLFLKAVRPFLRPSRCIFHVEGYWPYFPWWINGPVHFWLWGWRKAGTLSGLVREYQGSWADWDRIMRGEKWQETIGRHRQGLASLGRLTTEPGVEKLFFGNVLSRSQKNYLLQTLYILGKGAAVGYDD